MINIRSDAAAESEDEGGVGVYLSMRKSERECVSSGGAEGAPDKSQYSLDGA